MKCEFDRPSGVECTFAADKQFDSDFDNDVVVIDSLADFLENKYDRVCVVNVNVNHSPNSCHFSIFSKHSIARIKFVLCLGKCCGGSIFYRYVPGTHHFC